MAAYPATLPAPLAAGYAVRPQDQTLRNNNATLVGQLQLNRKI